jgi:hypothetical protein
MARDEGIFRHPFSWRSRIFRAVVALLLLVLVVRLVWGWQTHRALAARLAELREAGQPVEVGDVVQAKVPNAENAWHYQMLAAAALVPGVDSPASSNLAYPNYPPYPAAWWRLAEASERANGKALAMARRAREFPRSQNHDGFDSPSSMTVMPSFNKARWLANTLGDGALYAHLKADDAGALDRVLDLLHLSRSLRRDDTMIGQLVGIGIEALALDRIEVIAPGLRLRAGTDAAARERVKQVIRQLLDEELAWRGLTASLVHEQLWRLEKVRKASRSAWLIRPLADRQERRDIGEMQLAIEASRLRTKPRAAAVLAKLSWDEASTIDGGASWGLNGVLLPRYSRVFDGGPGRESRYIENAFRAIGERRAAAVDLAAQLYRADHGGAWPARLEELAPAYLPAVPADPYYDDGRPLGYVVLRRPDGGARPMVYFDAGDAKDVVISREPMYGWQVDRSPVKRGYAVRQYRDLSRFAPSPSPSTKAVDHEPEKAEAPGDEAER